MGTLPPGWVWEIEDKNHGRAAGDRIDGWWSRKAAIGDSRRARVLVFMQRERRRFPIERNGARKKPRASTLNFTLDTAVVVIDVMTNRKGMQVPGLVMTNRKRKEVRGLDDKSK